MRLHATVLALALGTASALVRTSPSMAVPCAVQGFGRIGRLVARIMVANPEVDLKLINCGYDAEYMAYQFKYDSIHGRYGGTVEVDGDTLVIDGKVVSLSHTRNPSEIPFAQ